MRIFKKYLQVTSVLFHLAIVTSLFWIVPFFIHSANVGESWANSIIEAETGVIEEVSEIIDGKLKYKGYKVKYNEQSLYVSGLSSDDFKKGEIVNVMVNEHPYQPLETLMVTISKKTPCDDG